jgi:hypothetical protein
MVKNGEDSGPIEVTCSLCEGFIPPEDLCKFYTQHSNPLCGACAGKEAGKAYTDESRSDSSEG